MTEHAACTTERVVCAHCAHDRACDNALCCTLFGSLFMDTVKKKKKYKNDHRELGRHSVG